MVNEKTIGVVVPCFNEESLLPRVLETMPDFVDRVIIIDDCSSDSTSAIANEWVKQDPARFLMIRHEENLGVGGAIASGYKQALRERLDVVAVMAGDAQMSPDDLPAIIDPVVRGECEYTKGNRLFSGDAWTMIPKIRYLGNAILSLLTKIASGYWHVADSQSGYTAISLDALQVIDWDRMYRRYGQPNDLLVRLNIDNFRVCDIPIQPVYGIGERSGLRPIRAIPGLAWLLLRLFLMRLKDKYVIRDFHPLVFFYAMGGILFPLGTVFGLYLMLERLAGTPVAETSALFAAFLAIMGLQFLLFAMWFDMEYNKELRVQASRNRAE